MSYLLLVPGCVTKSEDPDYRNKVGDIRGGHCGTLSRSRGAPSTNFAEWKPNEAWGKRNRKLEERRKQWEAGNHPFHPKLRDPGVCFCIVLWSRIVGTRGNHEAAGTRAIVGRSRRGRPSGLNIPP
jgi:hypothetical protein